MTTECEQLDDLLFDATPLSMETAARHAAECKTCAEILAAWNDLSQTAASMRTTWQNDQLWPRIERSIDAERWRSPSWWWQVAAAVVLTVGMGGTLFQLVREETREAAFDRIILQVSAMDEVERAERAHLKAIENLEGLTDARLEESGTPLLDSYKEKLMLLDDAIAECQINIDSNRQNAHLRKQLLAMYTDKQRTLQDVLREDSSNVSTP